MKLTIPTICKRVSSYHPRIRDMVRQPDASLRGYSDVGCYPIFYLTTDHMGGDPQVACPECATRAHEYGCMVTHAEVNWETQDLECENCNETIDAAYEA